MLFCSSKLKLISALRKYYSQEEINFYTAPMITHIQQFPIFNLSYNIEFAKSSFCSACLILNIQIINLIELIYYRKS